jgi:DNA-binding SARP family transcriptional activator
MRGALSWLGMGVLAVSLVGTQWVRAGGGIAAGPAAYLIDSPRHEPEFRTPYRRALREAGFWLAMARQAAADEREARCAALTEWDPAASYDENAMRRQLLAADGRGYLARARQAARRAASLARGPAEKSRAAQVRTQLESVARGEITEELKR